MGDKRMKSGQCFKTAPIGHFRGQKRRRKETEARMQGGNGRIPESALEKNVMGSRRIPDAVYAHGLRRPLSGAPTHDCFSRRTLSMPVEVNGGIFGRALKCSTWNGPEEQRRIGRSADESWHRRGSLGAGADACTQRKSPERAVGAPGPRLRHTSPQKARYAPCVRRVCDGESPMLRGGSESVI